MKYNNQLPKIAMPIYGRHIQDLVMICMNLPSKEERNNYASMIVHIMKGLVPEMQVDSKNDLVYWEHLAIISDFKLDIDYPNDVTTKESLQKAPDKVVYPEKNLQNMHYGRNIQLLIEACCQLAPSEERTQLELLIANQMKRIYSLWSIEGINDQKILLDLKRMSYGKIDLCGLDIVLEDLSMQKQPNMNQTKKKNNKRKK